MRIQFYPVYLLILIPVLFGLSCVKPQPTTAKRAPPYRYFQDTVPLLTRQQANEIQQILAKHNAQGPGQVSVRIIRSLPPNTTIEKLAYEMINEEPGTKSDRVLFLTAYQSRKMRIETSPEVWPLLSDNECKRIIAEAIVPNFKKNQFYSGIKQGVERIVRELVQRK